MKISHLSYPVSPIRSSSCPQSSSSSLSTYSFDLSFSQPNTFINPRYASPSWIQAEQFETLHANTYVHNQQNHFFETSSEVPLDVISRTLVDEVQGDLCYINNNDNATTDNVVLLCESYSLDSLWDELENSETMSANLSPVTVNGEGKKIVAKKRGNPWTKDEHKLFILGLKKYGKGAWKNISREFVTTRSGIQVASHAQKFFKRHESITQRKRSSIHDITQVDDDFIVDLVGKGVLSHDEALALHTPDVESHSHAEKHDVQLSSNQTSPSADDFYVSMIPDEQDKSNSAAHSDFDHSIPRS